MSRLVVRIGLAALRPAESILGATERMLETLGRAAERDVEIVCFPEAYLPGLRGSARHPVAEPPDQAAQAAALERLRTGCERHGVAAIVGMEWVSELGLENRAFVIGPDGALLGHQTKNQITPGGEEEHYVPDGRRRVFRLGFRAGEVTFGIVICHEGWRYPETVRWATVRGAQVIFQPQWTGHDASEHPVADLDLARATRFYATRYAPERYRDAVSEE